MSQVIVNFLVNTGSDASPVFALNPRAFDYTISQDAQNYYQYEIGLINNALTRYQSNPTANGQSAATTIQQALANLTQWSQMDTVDANGNQIDLPSFTPATVDPNAPTFNSTTNSMNPITSTMNSDMATDLNTIISTFRAAGWDPTSSTPLTTGGSLTSSISAALQALIATSTASVFNINGVLSQTVSDASQASIIDNANTGATSIQQILMVDYVSQGNALLFNQMSELQDAIGINDTALQYLNSLQDLMNQKDPQQFILQLQTLNGINVTGANQNSLVNQYEAQSFNTALGTVAKFSDASLSAFFTAMTGGAALSLSSSNPGTLIPHLQSTDAATVLQAIEATIPGGNSLAGSELADVTTFANAIAAANAAGTPPITQGASVSTLVTNLTAIANTLTLTTNVVQGMLDPNAVSIQPPQTGGWVNNVAAITQSTQPNVFQGIESLIPGASFLTSAQTNDLIAFANAIAAANANGTGPVLTGVTDPKQIVSALLPFATGSLATSPTIQALLTLNANPTLSSSAPTLQGWANRLAVQQTGAPLSQQAFQNLQGASSTIFNYSKSQILSNLQYLIQQIGIRSGATSGSDTSQLTIALTQVENDINNASSLQDWVQDVQQAQGTVGTNQNDLSNAIVASESFNDTERENLRSVMFTFEEFYKSASSLLDDLNQLLGKMADSISRT